MAATSKGPAIPGGEGFACKRSVVPDKLVVGQFDGIYHGAGERGGYPSLNLAAPSMVTRESEASRSTIPVPLAAYDAPDIPPLSLQ